jgi:K+ transporter
MVQRLFLATSAITADAAEYFNLPCDRTVIVGSQVEVFKSGRQMIVSGGGV